MADPASSDPVSSDFVSWGTRAAPARHALLRIEPSAFAAMRAARPDLAGEALLVDWAERNRPLIARRRGPCDAPGSIAAGLPLPPAQGKKRIALQLPPDAIRAVEPPPRLVDVAPCAPAAWRATIDAVHALCLRAGAKARAFGSLAWCALTGLDYLGAGSDLDLLFEARPGTDVAALLDGLARIEASAPMRLDGEIIRPEAGLAANWRELCAGAGEVLVKTIDGAALWPSRAFLVPNANGAEAVRAAS